MAEAPDGGGPDKVISIVTYEVDVVAPDYAAALPEPAHTVPRAQQSYILSELV
jgi:hypothetical protein